MGVISRNAKAGGGTGYTDDNTIEPVEVNDDFDQIYIELTGGLNEDNMSGSTQIPNSMLVAIDAAKVTDHAESDAVFLTSADPGDSGTPLKPTDLEGEIETVRFRARANNGNALGLNYMTSAGALAVAGWTEPAPRGRNMFPNPGFEVQSGAANSAPDGWTLDGTPTAVTIEAPAHTAAGLEKKSVRILASAINEGISYVVRGLKPGIKYLVGVGYTLTAGEMNVSTTNGLASGHYQNLSFTETTTGGGFTVFQGIVKTNSTPSDLTVSILSSAASDDFNLYYVWFHEMSDEAPYEAPHIPMQTASDETELIYPVTVAGGDAVEWETITPLSLEQYVPYEGYRFIYEVTVNWIWEEIAGAPDTAFADALHGLRIQLDSGSGAASVEGPHMILTSPMTSSSGMADGHIVTIKHIVENPTPGLTYAFTCDIGVYVEAAQTAWGYAIVNPLRGSVQGASRSRLYTERI